MIKKVLILLLMIEAVLLGIGLYRQWVRPQAQDPYLGIFTLIFFLVIIPLFLYWRFKDRDLSRYQWRKPPNKTS
ncbi:MAG: hypothetical protein GXO24_02140 [Chlorobi bacterium]|nr:hypothetical protein [Chlorobiota bacterium]